MRSVALSNKTMIFNEVFDNCYNVLSGTFANVRKASERKRFNRAMLALRAQNWFLGGTFQNATGVAGVTGIMRTQPLERRLIIRGGGMNTFFIGGDGLHFDVPSGGALNLQVTRSGSSRAQISKNVIRNAHYFSTGEAQPFELDWPVPWVLDRNEIILVNFTQISAVSANTIYALVFYGVTIDKELRCEDWLIQDIKAQIIGEPIQKPRYIHLKTDKGAGGITFPANAANQRAVANTIEAPEHMLAIGFRKYMIGMGPAAGPALLTTMRLSVTGGNAFSRIELPANGFEYFNRPGDGYFRFAVPHFIPKGASLSLSLTSSPTRLFDQFEGELELLCVSV